MEFNKYNKKNYMKKYSKNKTILLNIFHLLTKHVKMKNLKQILFSNFKISKECIKNTYSKKKNSNIKKFTLHNLYIIFEKENPVI